MSVESGKPSLPLRTSAVRSGAATSASSLAVSAAAAIAGAYLAHKFGRNAETDGFLAAYSVYFVIVLTAQASRLVIVPDLTRAALEGRLTAEFFSFAVALLTVAIPATVLTVVLAGPIGEVLTGRLPETSASIASRAIVWLVPAALAQMLAALASSALAAGDSYVVAAVGYALGAIAGVVVFVALADAHGMIALAWGLALNGAIAAGLPLLALRRSGRLHGERGGGAAVRVRAAEALLRGRDSARAAGDVRRRAARSLGARRRQPDDTDLRVPLRVHAGRGDGDEHGARLVCAAHAP